MKEIEEYRAELNKFIEEHDFDLSNEEVVKKTLEVEKAVYDIYDNAQKKD